MWFLGSRYTQFSFLNQKVSEQMEQSELHCPIISKSDIAHKIEWPRMRREKRSDVRQDAVGKSLMKLNIIYVISAFHY